MTHAHIYIYVYYRYSNYLTYKKVIIFFCYIVINGPPLCFGPRIIKSRGAFRGFKIISLNLTLLIQGPAYEYIKKKQSNHQLCILKTSRYVFRSPPHNIVLICLFIANALGFNTLVRCKRNCTSITRITIIKNFKNSV